MLWRVLRGGGGGSGGGREKGGRREYIGRGSRKQGERKGGCGGMREGERGELCFFRQLRVSSRER